MLKLSKNVGLTDIVSDANPITTEHNITGTSVEVPLWIFNDGKDDAGVTYASPKKFTTIVVDPVDTTGSDESAYVQLAVDNAGSAGTYAAGSATLSIADIQAVNSATKFWAKITTPAVADSQNKSDIKLQITAKEYAV